MLRKIFINTRPFYADYNRYIVPATYQTSAMNAICGAASSLIVEYFDPIRHAMPLRTNIWCDLFGGTAR